MAKITPVSIARDEGKDLEKIKKEVRLYDLFGIVKEFRTALTARGLWVDFLGEFEAIAPSGRVYKSNRAMLPVKAEEVLEVLSAAKKEHEKARVQLAASIVISPGSDGLGVEYSIRWLLKPEMKVDLWNVKRLAHAG